MQDFLVAVIRRRGHPLHLANLWNALYFNYDLDYGGFRADHLEQKRIPTREAHARAWSLPIGGFVRVHTEMDCGDLLAEVIYKEGAHVDVDRDGWLDPALSGAPATVTEQVAGRPVSTVRERFVLDLDAFGPDGNTVTQRQYARLCERARWLDPHGHLLMEAMYEREEGELEDLDYYADYLMREHREGLLAFCFAEELNDDELLREALLRSLDAVRELALTAQELRSWRDKYFFIKSEYSARVDDGDLVLGGGDLQSIARGLMRVPGDAPRCYAAIRPRIIEVLKRGDLTREEEASVRGCAYVSAVCHANTYIADALAKLQPSGVLQDGVHLRLDDDWQGGGIWRAERIEDADRYSLKNVPPTIPLGLGRAESAPAAATAENIAPDEQPIAGSQTGFRVTLSLRDRALGRLRLSEAAVKSLGAGAVDVAIRHESIRERYGVDRDGTCLYGISYPLAFHPGLVLYCNVENRGSVVRIRTERVTPPAVASNGTRFDYETNVAVYERELGLKELPQEQRRGAPTLRELINRALRERGRKRDGGGYSLTLGELATVILGPAWTASETRPIAEAAATMGLGRDGTEYVWSPRVTSRTRASDRSLLRAYGEATARGRLDRVVRRHWVPMHLRRYTERSGRAPSHAKRASYPEMRRKFGMYGVLPEELPPNCTWVEPYSWGDEPNSGDNESELAHALRDPLSHADGLKPVAEAPEQSGAD